MNSKVVYQTDHLGLYVGQVEAEESPLEPGIFLIPGGCVEDPPPECPLFKTPYWTGTKWQLVDYFNGLIVYHTTTQDALTLSGPGPIPSGYTVKQPQPGQVWKNAEWVDDLDTILAKLYPQKRDAINDGCAHFIQSGFNSAALGESHRYDSTLEDQVNLCSLMLSGADGMFAFHGSDDVKVLRVHTAAQLHSVGQQLVGHKQAALRQAQALKLTLSQALADRDVISMRHIEWRPPV